MPAVSFTKAEVERAVIGARAAGISVSEVRIEKTPGEATIRIFSGGLPDDAGKQDDGPQPEPW